MAPTRAEIVAGWRESAPYWEKHAALLRGMFAPITDAMVAAAGATTGQRVLDVACGTGDPALRFAELVGRRGALVCTDAAAEMVAAARRELAGRAPSATAFVTCSADALPFASRRFDHVVCRLGAMFFPDVGAALGEMLRVTRPGGRVTAAVWAGAAENPLFSVVTDVLARHVPAAPEPPDAPGAFRFAEPGRLAGHLRAAGAADVAERAVRFAIEAPLDFDGFWTLRREMSESLREKLRRLAPERSAAFLAELRAAARPYFTPLGMRFPAAVIVVTAVRPAG